MSRKRKWTILVGLGLIGLFVLFMSIGAVADNPTNVSVSATIGPTIQLNMPTTTVDFGGGSLEPGQNYGQVISATVNSNRDWQLAVTKDQDLTSGSDTIPSANLTFGATAVNFTETYEAPAGTEFGTDTVVVSGNRGGGLDTNISYSLDVPWTVPDGVYTATHTYTATQP